MNPYMIIERLGDETTITVRAEAGALDHVEREAALAAQKRSIPLIASGAFELIQNPSFNQTSDHP